MIFKRSLLVLEGRENGGGYTGRTSAELRGDGRTWVAVDTAGFASSSIVVVYSVSGLNWVRAYSSEFGFA